MKIVYWSPYVGHVGTIKAVINSAVSMRKYGGHDVTIIKNHSEWEGYEESIRQSGVNICDFKLKKVFPGLQHVRIMGSRIYMLTIAMVGFFQLTWYVRRKSPDILVTNLIAVPAILATRLARRRVKIIASVQGFPKFLGMPANTKYPVWMKLEDKLRKALWNRVYKYADVIVCMTESTCNKLIENTSLPEHLFRVINNPVIEDDINSLVGEKPQDSWLFDSGFKSLIAIGRLTRQKDFLTLVKSLEIVNSELNLRAAILGEGEDRDELEFEIQQRGLSDCVRLYGFVEIPYSYLGYADLFVLTSRWEDPGHAILEAAALGIPIVSTDCPSGPAALLEYGKGGRLCPVGDFASLAREILASLRTTNHVEQTAIARKNAYKFTLRGHYEGFKSVFDKWQLETLN